MVLKLCALGINHNTTPIALRERLAISASEMGNALFSLRKHIPGGIILSTCNRTEVYTAEDGSHKPGGAAIDFLEARSGIPPQELVPLSYLHRDKAAIEHLFRVASGLDSMIVGEFEVLGQVRQALEEAERAQAAGLPLLNLFRQAVRVGRRVRDETELSRNALSVSSVAVDLVTRVVGDLSRCNILVVGAGEAGKLVARAAKQRGTRQMVVTSRSQEVASNLAAALGGRAAPLSDLKEEMADSDIVISCTGAPHTVLDRDLVGEVMCARQGRPLVITDIAVPRDVEPGVEEIENVYLYNIDHLTEVSRSNRRQREREIRRAEGIIAEEREAFYSWWQSLETRPTVTALMTKAEGIRKAQLEKTLKKVRGLSAEEREALESMTKAIVQKILHDPIQHLKESPQRDSSVQAVHELFRLDEDR